MRVAVVSCDMVPPGSSKLPAIVAFVNYLLGFFALPFFQDGRLTPAALQGGPHLVPERAQLTRGRRSGGRSPESGAGTARRDRPCRREGTRCCSSVARRRT